MANVNNTLEYIIENAENPEKFISECEDKYNNKIKKIAKDIAESEKTEIVMLAGPSSSGKTTTAKKLCQALSDLGVKSHTVSLDDFYLNNCDSPRFPDGTPDYETVEALDIPCFEKTMTTLIETGCALMPEFDFLTGKRKEKYNELKLGEKDVIIVEGLHGLNPSLLPDGFNENLVYKVYVSPLLPLNLDDHNRIGTSYLRLLRRTVRDFATRGASVQRTLSMWDSVRRGEERWIFPYQENADFIFNSSTLYELAVLKKHIFPLLTAIEPSEECYDQVRAMVKILNYVHEAEVDDEIPPTSIVREFIGGNTFYKNN